MSGAAAVFRSIAPRLTVVALRGRGWRAGGSSGRGTPAAPRRTCCRRTRARATRPGPPRLLGTRRTARRASGLRPRPVADQPVAGARLELHIPAVAAGDGGAELVPRPVTGGSPRSTRPTSTNSGTAAFMPCRRRVSGPRRPSTCPCVHRRRRSDESGGRSTCCRLGGPDEVVERDRRGSRRGRATPSAARTRRRGRRAGRGRRGDQRPRRAAAAIGGGAGGRIGLPAGHGCRPRTAVWRGRGEGASDAAHWPELSVESGEVRDRLAAERAKKTAVVPQPRARVGVGITSGQRADVVLPVPRRRVALAGLRPGDRLERPGRARRRGTRRWNGGRWRAAERRRAWSRARRSRTTSAAVAKNRIQPPIPSSTAAAGHGSGAPAKTGRTLEEGAPAAPQPS